MEGRSVMQLCITFFDRFQISWTLSPTALEHGEALVKVEAIYVGSHSKLPLRANRYFFNFQQYNRVVEQGFPMSGMTLVDFNQAIRLLTLNRLISFPSPCPD